MNGQLWILNSVLLGAGLAMDAFSVSLANGLHEPHMGAKRMSLIAGVFGGFQTLMPLLGWAMVRFLIDIFKTLEPFVPWIALILLVVIGGKMIWEGFRNQERIGKGQALLTDQGDVGWNRAKGGHSRKCGHGALRRENHPGQGYENKGHKPAALVLAFCYANQKALCALEDAVHEAPHDEVKAVSVPQAADNEHDQDVPVGAEVAALAAAKGEVDVLLKPGAEGNVPAPPKLSNGAG